MPQPKSRISKDILRDQGAPQRPSPDEQMSGAGMDDVDRSDWPVGEDVTALAPTVPDVHNSGIRFLAREFR